MNKAILLILSIIGYTCLGQNNAVPAPSQAKDENEVSKSGQAAPPQVVHMEQVPDSTKAILQLIIPKIHLKASTLPEVTRFFERESRSLDPDHIGVKIVIITPKDLGYSNESSPYVIWFSATHTPFADALTNVAQLFNMKLEIRKDIYIMPTFADFQQWEKKQQ